MNEDCVLIKISKIKKEINDIYEKIKKISKNISFSSNINRY